jgi:hypothetical protein
MLSIVHDAHICTIDQKEDKQKRERIIRWLEERDETIGKTDIGYYRRHINPTID